MPSNSLNSFNSLKTDCNQNYNLMEGAEIGLCPPEQDGTCGNFTSTMPSCITDCEECHWLGSLGWCCSGMCIQLAGQKFGYCKSSINGEICENSGLSNCISDCENCTYSGSLGFCCSGMCNQGPGQSLGYCQPYQNNTKKCQKEDFQGNELFLKSLPYLLSGIVIIVLGILSLWLWKNLKNQKISLLNKDEITFFYKGCNKTYFTLVSEIGESYSKVHQLYQHIESIAYNNEFELPESAFKIEQDCILGEGEFGRVFKGKVNGTNVAVKTLNDNVNKIYLKSLLTELKVLIYLGSHENIVNLVGAYTAGLGKGKIYIFLEFCALGSLDDLLRKHKKLTCQNTTDGINGYSKISMVGSCPELGLIDVSTITFWCSQIAKALSYLAEKNVVHADVAGRNVLICSQKQAKLSDFGLSRRLYEQSVYSKKQQEPLPWRWMAIESLQSLIFSTQSDIWSFGVFIWEAFSYGELPFPERTWSQSFVQDLKSGLQLEKPLAATDDIYCIMHKCWEIEATNRPSADMLVSQLLEVLHNF